MGKRARLPHARAASGLRVWPDLCTGKYGSKHGRDIRGDIRIVEEVRALTENHDLAAQRKG